MFKLKDKLRAAEQTIEHQATTILSLEANLDRQTGVQSRNSESIEDVEKDAKLVEAEARAKNMEQVLQEAIARVAELERINKQHADQLEKEKQVCYLTRFT